MKHSDFVHLHVHTQYSLLDGMIKVKVKDKNRLDLVRKAAEYKMPALAITDHGALYGAVEFYEAALAQGVKPIVGCEMYITPGDRRNRTAEANNKHYHLILLAQDLKGYKNLCSLVSKAHTEGFYRKPRIDRELLATHHEGLIATSACLKGEIPSFLMRDMEGEARKTASFYKDLFGDRFYVEVQVNGLDDQIVANRRLIELSKSMDFKLVATNDCHYLERDDAYAHEALLCVQTGKTINDPARMKLGSNEFYFKSPAEMRELFAELPEAVDNTLEIAERCNLKLELNKFHFPRFDLPAGQSADAKLEIDAKHGLDARLEHIKRARPGFSAEDDKVYRDRLEFELSIIKKMEFAGYFLIVSDFIEWARKNDIAVGPGRGSAVGCLLAYCLGITALDPLNYNLLFERFLNPERVSMPDIDVDFCADRRDEVIKYVTDKYGGGEFVSQIATLNKMNAKAAIRDAGRALDIGYAEVDAVAKLVPDGAGMTFEKAFAMEPRFAEVREADPRIDQLVNLAVKLEGLARNSSVHAAGVVISDRPLIEYMPVFIGKNGENLSMYDHRSIERIGLIKFDFLSIKDLTVLQKTVKLIEKNNGVKIILDELPLDDKPAWDLICKGDTAGIFQLESDGMTDLMTKMKPGKLEDLTAAIALYRPGPMGMIPEFISRKAGKVKIKYPHPSLEPILRDTYGTLVYQEQVMQIAQVMAGYTKGEADVLRKAMGKKQVDMMASQREKFLTGAEKLKIAKTIAVDVFDLMEKFGEYGFNKSHSAGYALISYQAAYLKAHYPIEFMSQLLSSDMDNTEKIVKYIAECREKSLEILPPDVNESVVDFTVENKAIRFGLKAIKNVGQGAIEALIESRAEGGKFKDLYDFTARVDSRRSNKKVIESLIKAGAFDSTGARRGGMLEVLESCIAEGQSRLRDKASGQESLFGAIEESSPVTNHKIPEIKLAENVLLQYEKESLGFFLSGHPLARMESLMKRFANMTTDRAHTAGGGSEVRIAGIVAGIRETYSKKKELMAFVNFEDLNGFIEVLVWPETYKNYGHMLKTDRPLLVIGKLEAQSEKAKIIADKIIPLEEAPAVICSKVHVKVPMQGLTREQLIGLKDVIRNHQGQCSVILHFIDPGKTETIMSLPDRFKVRPGENFNKAIQEALGKGVSVLEAA